jgi:PKD repeat protein
MFPVPSISQSDLERELEELERELEEMPEEPAVGLGRALEKLGAGVMPGEENILVRNVGGVSATLTYLGFGSGENMENWISLEKEEWRFHAPGETGREKRVLIPQEEVTIWVGDLGYVRIALQTERGKTYMVKIPPKVEFTLSPDSVYTGEVVYFEDSSWDIDGRIISRYWDLGNGITSKDRNGAWWQEPGTHEVTLIVKDDDGLVSVLKKEVQVKNREIIDDLVDFTHTEEVEDGTIKTVEMIHFEVSQITEVLADPEGRIVRWHWDFGDDHTSDLRSPSHFYSEEGTYTVRLTVWDEYGDNENYEKTIHIQGDREPVVYLFGYPGDPRVKSDGAAETVEFYLLAFDPDDILIKYEWNEGLSGYAPTWSPSETDVGTTKSITLTVGDGGQEARAAQSIEIKNALESKGFDYAEGDERFPPVVGEYIEVAIDEDEGWDEPQNQGRPNETWVFDYWKWEFQGKTYYGASVDLYCKDVEKSAAIKVTQVWKGSWTEYIYDENDNIIGEETKSGTWSQTKYTYITVRESKETKFREWRNELVNKLKTNNWLAYEYAAHELAAGNPLIADEQWVNSEPYAYYWEESGNTKTLCLSRVLNFKLTETFQDQDLKAVDWDDPEAITVSKEGAISFGEKNIVGSVSKEVALVSLPNITSPDGLIYGSLNEKVPIYPKSISSNKGEEIYYRRENVTLRIEKENAGGVPVEKSGTSVGAPGTVLLIRGDCSRIVRAAETCPAEGWEVYEGEQIELIAKPLPRATFVGWSGDITSSDESVTITMDSNKSITAKFKWVILPDPPLMPPAIVHEELLR